jgi:hypothetical protein
VTISIASTMASRDSSIAPSSDASASRLCGGTRPMGPEPSVMSITTPSS